MFLQTYDILSGKAMKLVFFRANWLILSKQIPIFVFK